MKRKYPVALVLSCCLTAAAMLPAQTSAKKPADGSQQPASQPNAQQGANPFPTDTSNVPVLPSKITPDIPVPAPEENEGARFTLPGGDSDPVASPDAPGAAYGNAQDRESSSDVKGLDSLLPKPGDAGTDKKGRNRSNVLDEAPKETSKEDINVGQYYLDNKNWRAALSRFQSALVLAPDEPEVYWGLAESERHLGDFARARANYQKVIEYDPDSKHAKEAKKALKDPEIENAKAAPGAPTPP